MSFYPLVTDLTTQDYTKVMVSSKKNFFAPHDFKVVNSDTEEILAEIHFQEGPVKEFGVNGVAHEDLIAMIICRLASFQAGTFNCMENEMAIIKLQEALMWLRKRTNNRKLFDKEGTSNV